MGGVYRICRVITVQTATSDRRRVEMGKLPHDWCDLSLYRAAARVNENEEIPANFPEETLEYLRELGRLLPRRRMFIKDPGQVILHASAFALPVPFGERLLHFHQLWRETGDAIANQRFEDAVAIREQRMEVQRELAQSATVAVRRRHVDKALRSYGIKIQE